MSKRRRLVVEEISHHPDFFMVLDSLTEPGKVSLFGGAELVRMKPETAKALGNALIKAAEAVGLRAMGLSDSTIKVLLEE